MTDKKTFLQLLKEQLEYGGVKYKNSGEKEVTDILTERYGLNGLLWCINKYVFRYKNLGRERDLLKIGAYMYILWLKFGYHLDSFFPGATVNTTVDVKLKHLDQFLAGLEMYKTNREIGVEDAIEDIDILIQNLSGLSTRQPWILYEITVLTEHLYNTGNFDGSDADTYNETGGKPN